MGRVSFAKPSRTRGCLHWIVVVATIGVAVVASTAAHAQQVANDVDADDTDKTVRASADPARFLPGVVAADAGAALVAGSGWAGYDGATHAPLMGAFAEARLARWLILGVGVVYAQGNDLQPAAARPSVVARAQILDQRRHGVDASVAFAYREDRYVGEDGFFQGALSVGRRGEAGVLLANLSFGSDGEGDDHVGELRLVGLARLGRRFSLGLDGDLRRSIDSTDPRRSEHGTPSFEYTAGPTATCTVGPLALFVETGVTGAQLMRLQNGLLALGGMGAVF
jgi:hypothetical protein